jgi:hypothetical protein
MSGVDKIKITYTFKISKNEQNVVVADDFTPVNKKGHEYIWVGYENVTNNGKLETKPFCAFVEKVFETGDFSLLGIGG